MHLVGGTAAQWLEKSSSMAPKVSGSSTASERDFS